ncbi:MAG: ParA family protein [Gammaproteobacteria bacterium]|nr:ParA family protein [Gammaproteobacteria bacterium]
MPETSGVGFSRPSKRITLLNYKGGCGKTLIAVNVAGYYALKGYKTTLIDHDRQGSAMHWLALRDRTAPAIHGINAGKHVSYETRTWQLHVPPDTERVVVDSPAGLHGHDLEELVQKSDIILVPVLPSEVDIHAAAAFIGDLLLDGRLRHARASVGVIANRVRANTRVYESLKRFLSKLDFPMIAELRDTQNYLRAAERGLSIHDIRPATKVQRDVDDWAPLVEWLERPERQAPTAINSAGGGTRMRVIDGGRDN